MKNNNSTIHLFIKQYITCGIFGWCMEILFTSLHALRRQDPALMGSTSLWMFPIYGLAALLRPISHRLHKQPAILRGFLYACIIFLVEFISGRLLQQKGACPWDYGRSKWNIKHVIRLDYLPNWMIAGLLFERILK
ncbi:MAG: hypothetical protein RRX92_06845 [Lachnospiraceae bacterium]